MTEPFLNQRLNQTIAETVARQGIAVSDQESVYGWQDFEALRHRKGWTEESRKYNKDLECAWVCPENPEIEEVYVSEFMDTYTDNSETCMINLFHVSCSCGKYTDRTIRYEGAITEFIPQMFQERWME